MKYRILERLKKFVENFSEVKLIYVLSVVVFVCAIGLLGWFVFQYLNIQYPISNIFEAEDIVQTKPCEFHRLIDGVCVGSENRTNPNLVAIMIENHVDARPQSGLTDASVVYEAPVEANYTRFMAIYPADADVSEIGPVRSARPYYLDWLAEYGSPLYMHCGGSPDALNKIREYEIFDVNEFYYGKTFWRSQSRIAPHNVYTASERWDKLIIEQEILNTKQIDRWIFSTTTTFSTPSTNQITISFLAPDYVVDWKYNSSTQKYERWQAGAEHRDADGVLITADTVIVQHVKTKVLDEIGRLSMITIGTGPAKVYIYGNKVEGTWVKTDRTSGTKFLDSSGEKIKLKPGKIWIEIANQNTTTNA